MYKAVIKKCAIVLSPVRVVERYVCPIVGCASVVLDLRAHLKKSHRTISKEQLDMYVKNKVRMGDTIPPDCSPLKGVACFKPGTTSQTLNLKNVHNPNQLRKVDQSCIEYPPPAFSSLKGVACFKESATQTLNSQDIHNPNRLGKVDQSCIEYPPPAFSPLKGVACF